MSYLKSTAHERFAPSFARDIRSDGIVSMNDNANINTEQNARRSLIPIRRLLGSARRLFRSQSAFQFLSLNGNEYIISSHFVLGHERIHKVYPTTHVQALELCKFCAAVEQIRLS